MYENKYRTKICDFTVFSLLPVSVGTKLNGAASTQPQTSKRQKSLMPSRVLDMQMREPQWHTGKVLYCATKGVTPKDYLQACRELCAWRSFFLHETFGYTIKNLTRVLLNLK